MRAVINSQNVDIRFQYDEVALFRDKRGKTIYQPTETLEIQGPGPEVDNAFYVGNTIRTMCIVSSIDESKSGRDKFVKIAEAEAVCSLSDKFTKITGRKLALARVMQFLKLGRVDRTLVWDSFFRSVDGGISYFSFVKHIPSDIQECINTGVK